MSQNNIVLDAASNELEVIIFYIEEELPGGEIYTSYYGMNVAKVLSIIRRPTVTGMPTKHHPAALGTFNLRGSVLPLVDLALWLGKKIKSPETAKVIVSEFSSQVTAFLVSGVMRIHRMNWNAVEPPGKYLQDFSRDCVTGVVHFDKHIVFLLDMEQVIASMNPKLSLGAREHEVEETADGRGYTVLIADDSAAIRATIAKALEKSGFTVIRTNCGREAWEEMVALKAKADAESKSICDFVQLIVSDIEMPEMDGHALTRRIKEAPEFKHLPVILFSSLISEVVRQKGVKAGADDQISKPDLPILAKRALDLIRKQGKQ